MLDLAVIIVSWNVRDYLRNCLSSVFAELNRSGLQGEVWVVDNGSTDGTPEVVRDLFPRVNLLVNENNPGFGAANNQAMTAASTAKPRYYFLLNPDTVVRPCALKLLVEFLDQNPDVGMAGARLVFGDGRFQHSAFTFPRIRQLLFDLFPMPARLYESPANGRYPRRLYAGEKPFAVDHPLGATMMVRRDVAEATGGFDESFYMYCEEIDWCWRIRQAGWKIYTVPTAEIIHYGGGSTGQIAAQSMINLWTSRARFYQRHYGRVPNAIARHLVARGMRRKMAQTDDPHLRNAYHQIISVWQQP